MVSTTHEGWRPLNRPPLLLARYAAVEKFDKRCLPGIEQAQQLFDERGLAGSGR